jgi:predicted dehydrogenase
MRTTRRGFLGAMTAASYMRVQGANERVQVGFIGYGLMGKTHVLDFRKLADVDCAAVAEVHAGRLDEGVSACGGPAKAYKDFRRMLESKDIQGVVVSTPDHWHCAMTILACAAGKDVYVEKPLTLFVREGRWMTAAARKYGRVVQTGSQQRSGAHYQKAIELMRSGYIGEIHSARIAVARNIWPGFGDPAPDGEAPAGFDYDQWLGPAPKRAYNPKRGIYHFRWFWDYSGGQMTNLGAHEIDIVQWFLGAKGPGIVASMGGRWSLKDGGETPDTQDAVFQYPHNFSLQVTMREAAVGRREGNGLEFFGSKGSLTISRAGFQVHPDMRQPADNLIPQMGGGHPIGGPNLSSVKPEPWIEARREAVVGSLTELHARNFVDCMKSRARPTADVEDGHRTAVACHLANISVRLGGRSVKWDAEREEVVGDREASEQLTRPYRKPWDEVLKLV